MGPVLQFVRGHPLLQKGWSDLSSLPRENKHAHATGLRWSPVSLTESKHHRLQVMVNSDSPPPFVSLNPEREWRGAAATG